MTGVNEYEGWDLPAPHLLPLEVAGAEIDGYNHVNNAVYLTWLDRTAWDHSAALGLPLSACLALDRGMAVMRSVITYLRPALLGDRVLIGTWLIPAHRKLEARRRFQIRRPADGSCLLRAEIEYVCIELSTGRPTRLPVEFKERYAPSEAVIAAAARLPPL